MTHENLHGFSSRYLVDQCYLFIYLCSTFLGLQAASAIERPCLINSTCTDENQYCRGYFNKRCVCQAGYRMNETTGMCEDIDECRERLVCDHYCINTLGSYRCSCQEFYQLKSDKHTCTLRTDVLPTGKNK
jgi:hypothetical protein